MKSVSIRELRESIGPLLRAVSHGEQIVVTRRGQPVARIIPEAAGAPKLTPYPLRGTLISMADDFDAPLVGYWEAAQE